MRVHVDRALAAGLDADVIAQLPVWRESGVFSERERAALELTESFTFIHDDGIPDDVYGRVGGVLSGAGVHRAVSWLLRVDQRVQPRRDRRSLRRGPAADAQA